MNSDPARALKAQWTGRVIGWLIGLVVVALLIGAACLGIIR